MTTIPINVAMPFARIAIERVPPRAAFCDWADGTSDGMMPCAAMAVVQVDGENLCRSHAIERLNAVHRAAVEEVHRLTRSEGNNILASPAGTVHHAYR